MTLLKLQFSGILDGHNALIVWNGGGDHIEKGGLAAARATRHHQVHPGLDQPLDELGHVGGQGLKFQQVG